MLKIAVPDLVSNSYFPAEAAVALDMFAAEGLPATLRLIFPVDRAYQALRDGEIDVVAGSAHSAVAAFPNFSGAQILCAQSQGMYWFLVMHSDLQIAHGDLGALKGKRIGAAPWVEMGLRSVLRDAGLDPLEAGIEIVPVPLPAEASVNFGLNAARALEARQIDGFWANGMAAEVATTRGIGNVVLDARRSTDFPSAFGKTFASLVVRENFVRNDPSAAAAIVRAIERTHAHLKSDVAVATRVGEKLFPASEAKHIQELVKRDLPFYDHRVTRSAIADMNSFLQSLNLIERPLSYEKLVTPGTSAFVTAE